MASIDLDERDAVAGILVGLGEEWLDWSPDWSPDHLIARESDVDEAAAGDGDQKSEHLGS